MKAVYETPHVHFESFAVNNAVASGNCADGTKDAGFYCLVGGKIDDVENMISSAYLADSCSGADQTNLGWQAANNKVYSAYATNTQGGDNAPSKQEVNSRLDWEGNTLTVLDQWRDTFVGWFYYCSGNKDSVNHGTSNWGLNADGDALVHTTTWQSASNNKAQEHPMVIGVWNSVSAMIIPS